MSDEIEALIAGLRIVKTSHLIMVLDTDGAVDWFRSLDPETTLSEADRTQILRAVADEIDRRIPVPQ